MAKIAAAKSRNAAYCLGSVEATWKRFSSACSCNHSVEKSATSDCTYLENGVSLVTLS
jgi:hypothetical protein